MEINNRLPSAISLKYTDELVETLAKEMSFDEKATSLASEFVSKHLPPLITPDVFAILFGVSKQYIYYLGMSENHYQIYEIEKPGGGKRQIEAPRRYLKLVQRWINDYILSTYQLPPFVTGFTRGKNIFTNAAPHLNNKNLMVVDIKSFFPSVKSGKVYRIFRNFGYSRKVSNLLTYLCIYRSRLPQGAPTSPSLANIAFLPIDLELYDLAQGWGCSYTRYADDIAFSGNTPFSNEDNYKVKQIVENSGFFVNEEKNRIIGGGGRQMLAGLVVNSAGLPPRKKRRQWRAIYHQASINPKKYSEKSSFLRGLASFVNEYNPAIAKEYTDIAIRVAALEK